MPSGRLRAETCQACGGQPGWKPPGGAGVSAMRTDPREHSGSSRLSGPLDAMTQTLAVEQQEPRDTPAVATSCLGVWPLGSAPEAVSSGLPCRLHMGGLSFSSPQAWGLCALENQVTRLRTLLFIPQGALHLASRPPVPRRCQEVPVCDEGGTLKTDLKVERKKASSVVCTSVFLSPFCHFKDQKEKRKGKKRSSFFVRCGREQVHVQLQVRPWPGLSCAPPPAQGGGSSAGGGAGAASSVLPRETPPTHPHCCSSWASGPPPSPSLGDTDFPRWGSICKWAVLLSLFQ